ncbi:MAG: VCBS repeat-containing protein [Kiritimatiellae bacterium]|nr:VCBS repeat-containing protein [Kiritimatiellia bacterium]
MSNLANNIRLAPRADDRARKTQERGDKPSGAAWRRALTLGLPLACLFPCAAARGQSVEFSQASDPPGIVADQTAYVEAGTNVVTTAAPPESTGYRFTHWTLNGARTNDLTGRALNPVLFTIYENTAAVAHYLAATNDTDLDGVPDWFEIQFYDTTDQLADSDTDADGFALLTEYARQYHPRLPDLVDGGSISRSRSALCILPLSSNYVVYTEQSSPAGFTWREMGVSNGTVVTTSNLSGENGDYVFGYWDLDGVRASDIGGRALNQVSVTVTAATVATAHYYSVEQDSDADGIPDWFEWLQVGTTTHDPGADTDADGFDLSTEYRRGYHAGLTDAVRPGGVSRARSALAMLIPADSCAYTIASLPPGYVEDSGVAETGTVVQTVALNGASAGYGFGYWTVNGERQQDALGVALARATFTVTTTMTVVAHYFVADEDLDTDGVPDWYEWHYVGATNLSAGDDGDGDGFTLGQEYARAYDPSRADLVLAGSISRHRSALATVNLQFFRRTEQALFEGVVTNFFTAWPTNVTGFVFGANSAPALGDWDGDGDLDLFVGASGGTLHVYENDGSPTVLNLYDRTTNFATMAGAWGTVPNPCPALGDWNGDGAWDLAVGGDTGVVRIVASTAHFTAPQTPAVDYGLDTGTNGAVPAFAEVNGDGRADLLALLPGGNIRVYTNTHSATTPFAEPYYTDDLLGTVVSNAVGLSAADVTHDGWLDVLVSGGDGRIWEFDNNTNGSYTLKSKVFGSSYTGFAERLTIGVADLDGDGDADYLAGFDGGGLIYLRNPERHLVVSPPCVTLQPNAEQDFDCLNATSTVDWVFVSNASSGLLDAVSGVYTAGQNAGCIDVLEARDADGTYGRAYVNVISPAEAAAVGKAIVLAGRRGADDDLWATTDFLADFAFNTLCYRGYPKAAIRYLSPEPDQDVDGNGLNDDIYGTSTWENAAVAFTNWAANTDKLFVYLVDHGGNSAGAGYFRLGPSETLSAAELDGWLDQLQDAYNTEVTLVLDFCYSGSFVDELGYAGPARRTILTACADNEPSYFMAGGLVSFSDSFFSGVMLGLDVQQSFEVARDTIGAYQNAWTGGNSGAGVYLGPTFLLGKDIPQIGRICDDQTLTNGTIVTLWADEIDSVYSIARVWCVIVPPGHNPDPDNPVIDLPELDLVAAGRSSRHEGTYDGFSEAGIYKVMVYAKDIWGSIAIPKSCHVTQSGFDERVVVLNAGLTNSAQWAAMDMMAARAYHTCRKRWLKPERIRYLSADPDQDVDADGTNDVAAAPSLANLADAVTNWAWPADKLTVYLVGEEANGNLRMNESETLFAAALDAWLDTFQASDRPVNVIMEFSYSGGYVEDLVPPAGRERITIACTSADKPATWRVEGQLAFSTAFLSHIFNGRSIGASFDEAYTTLYESSGRRSRQEAQLDDDGNGVANEGEDGSIADQRYIGTAFMTGDDTPAIGSVTPDTSINELTNSLTLWAADVTDMDGVSNVWCCITPPDYEGIGDVPETDLAWHAGHARHEAVYSDFTKIGTYAVTFFAQDVLGEFAPPKQCLITRFEQDDDADQMPDWWEALYFAGLTNADAATDDDGDTYSNWAEWLAGSDPTNGASMFRLSGVDRHPTQAGPVLSWPSLSNRVYSVDCRTNLLSGAFIPLVTDVYATPPANAFTDTVHGAETLMYYRIRVGKEE